MKNVEKNQSNRSMIWINPFFFKKCDESPKRENENEMNVTMLDVLLFYFSF